MPAANFVPALSPTPALTCKEGLPQLGHSALLCPHTETKGWFSCLPEPFWEQVSAFFWKKRHQGLG